MNRRKTTLGILLVALVALLAAASHAEAPTKRDTEVAGAITGLRSTLESAVQTCRPIVDEAARGAIDQLWAQWSDLNRDYVREAARINERMFTLIKTTQGAQASSEAKDRVSGLSKKAATEMKQSIESLPESKRQGKCYGILTSIANGDWNTPAKLPAEARYLEQRGATQH